MEKCQRHLRMRFFILKTSKTGQLSQKKYFAEEGRKNNVSFPLSPQSDVDDVNIRAKLLFANRQNVQVPESIAPPRGRSVKNKGLHKKS